MGQQPCPEIISCNGTLVVWPLQSFYLLSYDASWTFGVRVLLEIYQLGISIPLSLNVCILTNCGSLQEAPHAARSVFDAEWELCWFMSIGVHIWNTVRNYTESEPCSFIHQPSAAAFLLQKQAVTTEVPLACKCWNISVFSLQQKIAWHWYAAMYIFSRLPWHGYAVLCIFSRLPWHRYAVVCVFSRLPWHRYAVVCIFSRLVWR